MTHAFPVGAADARRDERSAAGQPASVAARRDGGGARRGGRAEWSVAVGLAVSPRAGAPGDEAVAGPGIAAAGSGRAAPTIGGPPIRIRRAVVVQLGLRRPAPPADVMDVVAPAAAAPADVMDVVAAPAEAAPAEAAPAEAVEVLAPAQPDPVIRLIRIVGRPPPTFGSSMGDHTTAFTVHVAGLQQALAGRTVADGAAVLDRVIGQLGLLPGAALIEALPPRQQAMWDEALPRLRGARARMLHPPPGASRLAALQECIAAYLELRELVPLSTVNTAAVAPALAGKGKGEDASALALQAAGIPQDPQALLAQVIGLLDVRAVALACIESDPAQLAELAPGVSSAADQSQRARDYVRQHLVALSVSFPGALAAIVQGPQLDAEPASAVPDGEAAMDAAPAEGEAHAAPQDSRARDDAAIDRLLPDILNRMVRPSLEAALEGELRHQRKALASLQEAIGRSEANAVVNRALGKRRRGDDRLTPSAPTELQKLVADEAHRLRQLNRLEAALGVPVTPSRAARAAAMGRGRRARRPPEKYSAEAENARQDAAARERAIAKQMAATIAQSARAAFSGDDADGVGPSEAATAEDALAEGALAEGAAAEDAEARDEAADDAAAPDEAAPADSRGVPAAAGPLAVQVVIDDAGIVSAVRTAGRPPSPFAGTMGAHTTAWAVHVDVVRQAVVGRSVGAALAAMADVLAPQREAMQGALGAAFAFPADSRDRIPSSPIEPVDELASLQDAIARHLEAVNFVAGATLPSADTGGKTEAAHRLTLLEHLGLLHFARAPRPHEARSLRAAIIGLLDVGGLDRLGGGRHEDLVVDTDASPLRRLIAEHLRAIEAAYPGALEGAGLDAPASLDSESVRVIEAAIEDAAETPEPSAKRLRPAEAGDSAAEASAGPRKHPDAAGVAGWDAAFGERAPHSDGLAAQDLTTSFLGPLRLMLPARGADVAVGRRWLDPVGNLQPDRQDALIDAYVSDIRARGSYLGQPEGPIAAALAGVSVRVYRDAPPPGFAVVSNVGGGDCLLHALSDAARIAAALAEGGDARGIIGRSAEQRALPGDAVAQQRADIAARLDRAVVAHAVIDIVHNEIEGHGTPGLGPAVQMLLFDAGLQRELAGVRYGRAYERAAREVDEARRGSARGRLPAAEPAGPVEPMEPAGPVEPMEPAGPGRGGDIDAEPIRPQEQYGDGPPSDHVALLHLGGNHYVAIARLG